MNLKFIKILGLYQLIAGALGILTFLFFLHTIDLLNVALNGLSIYSGYLLLKKDFKKLGITISEYKDRYPNKYNKLIHILSKASLKKG